jgi:hypothetical protein
MDLKHRTKQLVAAVALAGAVTAGTASVAFAADTGTSAPKDPSAQTHPALRRRLRAALGTVVADTIGIQRSDLRAALKSGQSIAEVAQAHGVAPQTVVDAVLHAIDTRVDQAVTNGRITADRGAAIKAKAADRVPQLVNRHFGQHASA